MSCKILTHLNFEEFLLTKLDEEHIWNALLTYPESLIQVTIKNAKMQV